MEHEFTQEKGGEISQIDKGKTYFKNRRAVLERQIDQLVCDLYSLTNEEIANIEGRS